MFVVHSLIAINETKFQQLQYDSTTGRWAIRNEYALVNVVFYYAMNNDLNYGSLTAERKNRKKKIASRNRRNLTNFRGI